MLSTPPCAVWIPTPIRERVRQEDKRHFDVIAVGDGTAKVDGIVAADAAAAFDKRLTELATAVCREDPAHPRTAPRRCDEGAGRRAQTGLRMWTAACPHRSEDAVAPTRMVINVIAGAETVLGGGSQPGYLEGYGVIDAEQVRALAEQATLSARGAVGQPRRSASLSAERRRRALGADARHDVPLPRLRPPRGDLRCRPHHSVQSRRPSQRRPHGPAESQMLCRQHHRVKTFDDGWRDEQLPDGTVIWTSPTGQIYRTSPGGIDLFPDMAAAVDALLPSAQTGRRNRSRERATRIARIRNRNRIQRPINEAHRRLHGHAGARSVTAYSATKCAGCCASSKADPAPAPTASGSTTHSNPKSCHPIGNRHPNHHHARRSALLTDRYGEATADRCHSPGTPLSS